MDVNITPKRCAIVAVYNGSKTLKRCIGQLVECPQIDAIILIDNHSNDNSLSIIRSFDSNRIVLLQQLENTGFAKANNIGFSYAINHGFTEALLINQDVYINESSLNGLISLLHSSSNVGVVSPIHLDAKGKGLEHYFEEILNKQNIFRKRGERKQMSKQVLFVNAACWLMKLKVVSEMGGFDPIFHTYGEDQNFCDRLQNTSYQLRLSFNDSVIHDKPAKSYHLSQQTLNQVHSSYRISQLIRPTLRKSFVAAIMLELKAGLIAKLKGDSSSFKKHLHTIHRIQSMKNEIKARRNKGFYQKSGLFLELD